MACDPVGEGEIIVRLPSFWRTKTFALSDILTRFFYYCIGARIIDYVIHQYLAN